jgi:glycosyltransferase involved in cell wall biosynthesis
VRIALLANASVIHTRRWGDYFHARGHEVELISLEAADGFDYPCEIVRSGIPWRFLRYPLATGKVRRLLDRFRPQVVNAHFVPNYGLMGVAAGHRPLVVSVWGSDVLVSGRRSPLHAARARYVLTRADRITTDAAMLTRAVCALGGSPERILTVPMGVDPEPYRAARREAARRAGDSSRNLQVVVSTRKLEPIYNVGMLIEALPALNAARPETQVLVVGEGPERAALTARAGALGGERVVFLGQVPHAEMPAVLARGSVYVSTSLSDSTSVSLLEAMASGAFPVVTDIEANREWIDEGVNGFLVPIGQPLVLAARVAQALGDPALRAQAEAENARRIDARATWKHNMAAVEQMFEELVRVSSGSRR